MGYIRLKIVTQTWGGRTLVIGKAFANEKGVDGEFWALPIANAQGKYLFAILEEGATEVALSADLRLKVLLPKSFKDQRGEQKTQWNYVGAAQMANGRIEGELFVLPLPNREGGVVRFVLREEDNRPAQPQGGYVGDRGSRERVREPFRDPELPTRPGRPQAPAGGPPAASGLRPQHRDGLAGQGATYGGAAANRDLQAQREFGEVPNDADVDDIPF